MQFPVDSMGYSGWRGPGTLPMPNPMQINVPPAGSLGSMHAGSIPSVPVMGGDIPMPEGVLVEVPPAVSSQLPPMESQVPGDPNGKHKNSAQVPQESVYSVPPSRVPPDCEEIRVDLHTLVRTLAYEAYMIRLCRDSIIYCFWLILAILCITLDTDIYHQFTMGHLLTSEFVERPFNADQTLKDVHSMTVVFDWLAEVWAPAVFQDSSVFQLPGKNHTIPWLGHNNITSSLILDWRGVPVGTCPEGYPAEEMHMPCKQENPEYMYRMTAHFDQANLMAFQWGTTAPAYVASRGLYCNVNYDIAHKGKCDPGWAYLRGKCYQYVKVATTYTAAQQRCTENRGTLVTVQSDIIQQFIGTLQQESGEMWYVDGKSVYRSAWLGARTDSQGVLRWITGGAVSASFSLLQEIPSNVANLCLSLSEDGSWDLIDCNTPLPYICQRAAPSIARSMVESHCMAADYAGTVKTTRRGITCKTWSSVSNMDWVSSDNSCRATAMSDLAPWCYIDGPAGSWDYCDVPSEIDCTQRCVASPKSSDIAGLAVRDLEQYGWGNGSTAYINLSFDVYNWNFRSSGLLRLAFDVEPTGYVIPMGDQWDHVDSALQVQRADYYWTGTDAFRLACEIMFLILTGVFVLWVFRKAYLRRGSWKRHFMKFWTIYDWVLMAWIIMTCIMRGIMLGSKTGDIWERMLGSPTTTISGAMGVSMVAIVLICFRGLKFLRAPAATRGLYYTLSTALPVVCLYVGVIWLVVLGYTIAGLYYFGFLFPQFSTFGNALVSTMFIGLGDWSLYGPLTSALADGKTSFFAGFWFWTYILLMIFLLLNMFVAIMVHAFGEEYKYQPPPHALLLPPGNSPHLRGYWLRPWSWRAFNCLTLMEGVPWIEKVELGLRVEQEVNVTLSGTMMSFTLRLCSRWHRRLLERATLLVLLPPDVILTYRDAWTSFLQRVNMKESEVLRFDDNDLTALFDEYGISARQRHFVRDYSRQLKSGADIDQELLLSAGIRCGDKTASCSVEVAQRAEGTVLGITAVSAGGLNDRGLVIITIYGLPDCNTWRTWSHCAIHPTAYKNLCLNMHPDAYHRDILSYVNPYVIVRCDTLISPTELGALTNRDIAPARCLVPHDNNFRPPKYYRYLIKHHGRCAKAVRHGAKAVGLILTSDPKTSPS